MNRLTVSAVVFLGLCSAALAQQQPAQVLNLTEPGSVAVGIAYPTVFDTRLCMPQIDGGWPWTGKVESVHRHLPAHINDRIIEILPPNNLPVGGLLAESRVLTRGNEATFPGIGQTRWTPPDLTLAVGPNHVVATVNSTMAFFGKDGTLQFSVVLDSTGNPGFFEDVGAGDFVVDPKCLYDHEAKRFIVLAIEVYFGSNAWLDVAVSDDSDPHGVWYKYRTSAEVVIGSATYWVDYPSMGYDSKAIYSGGNLFLLRGSGPSTNGILFRTYDKTPMLSGQPTKFFNLNDPTSFSAQAGHHFGSNQAGYYVSVGNSTTMNLYAVKDPVGTPTLVKSGVTVPSFTPSNRNSAPNNGGNIDPLDGRVFNVCWRNGSLHVGHPINVGGINKARWYQFNTNDWPNSGSPSLVQSGNIDAGSSIHTYYPTIFENKSGNVGVVLARSASNEYCSVQITGRRKNDPPGTMGALKQLKIGSRAGSGRWGDYYGITTDPTNDATFWCVGQFQDAAGWNSWIESFNIGFAKGDLNCDGNVDFGDIDPFVLALNDPNEYRRQYPDCDYLNGDINGDGNVDFGDIDPFVALLG